MWFRHALRTNCLYFLSLFCRGEKNDTVQRGKMGADGSLKLTIPERHRGYAGMSCEPCENELLQLKANYRLLKEKGYEVVTVSVDMDERVFRNTSETFPSKGKSYDRKGFDGTDFRNYGVMGKPACYMWIRPMLRQASHW